MVYTIINIILVMWFERDLASCDPFYIKIQQISLRTIQILLWSESLKWNSPVEVVRNAQLRI
jgi:hypothetical protein